MSKAYKHTTHIGSFKYIKNQTVKLTMQYRHWKTALNQFMIKYIRQAK